MTIAKDVDRLEVANREALALLGDIVQMIETEVGPEAMNRWSKPDPMAVLMTTYAQLAAPMITLRSALEREK